MNTKNKGGFTLVELMVVAIIVAILAAVAIPLMSANQTRARSTEADAGLGTIRTALRAMYAETSAYNEDLNGATITSSDPTSLPGISSGDLNGKFFLEGDYTMTLGASTYTLTATGNAARDVGGVTITLNQAGNFGRSGL